MSVSVTMPQLGESVTEGTVTRWLKKEGERVAADEPLLEVSTDKVDTEIPSPASGILRGIVVDEDETVEVGAQLAMIEDEASASGGAPAPASGTPASAGPVGAGSASTGPADGAPEAPAPAPPGVPAPPAPAPPSYAPPSPPSYAPPAPAPSAAPPSYAPPPAASTPGYAPPASPPPGRAPRPAPPAPAPSPTGGAPVNGAPAGGVPSGAQRQNGVSAPSAEPEPAGGYPEPTPLPSGGESPYVTPLVRKLAAEHGVALESIPGSGVGGRIRKQDVLDAARRQREEAAAKAAAEAEAAEAARRAAEAQPQAAPGQSAPGQAAAGQAAPAQAPGGAPARRAIIPSALRGTTQRMSRPRQVIAARMVESLQTSAQLTTVVEADVTNIARLRDRARSDFESREGVKLTFLPFFALATVEALKVHPKLNAVIDTSKQEVTYHDAEHLGIATDTERGLMVPVIHNAGDLNIGGLARKIADLAARTRGGQVGPDELAGGTFTLTNTGSRGALFDTPIINQPQVGILGVGTVVKRPVVMEDPKLGEVISVRSMVYLALTYDHRLVDGADAARFLATVKSRLSEGSFEAELGL